ncbi:hypothetical protein LTR53_015859 [Teratosphaeriaceae sp. CCFEE 6253]|nr:hypothetical protein LTR53_015859 [Teratosphaeriaceae sp. CCFEE 6253]
MDPSRASSIYSSDSNRKPTYLDYRSSIDTSSRADSTEIQRDYADSLSSAPSRAPPMPPSNAAASSRPSSRPSFMNYQSTSPAPSKPVAVPQLRSNGATPVAPAHLGAGGYESSRHGGTLLVFIVAEVHPQMVQYLQRWLKRWSVSAITVIGTHGYAAEIKQLKMDIYGVIGKLGREVGVQTHLRARLDSDEVSATVSETGEDLRGVLCSISYNSNTTSADALGIDGPDLALAWQRSVGALHAVARATMPLLTAKGRPGLFLVLESAEQSAVSAINKAACDALLDQLDATYGSSSITIDHVDRVLLPDAEPAEQHGGVDRVPDGYYQEDSDFAASESPTKLWAMWQNGMGNV